MKRKRHQRPRPAASTIPTITYDKLDDSAPRLAVLKQSGVRKAYRLIWTGTHGQYGYAEEDTTEYSTREGANVALKYLTLLITLHQTLYKMHQRVQELEAQLGEAAQPQAEEPANE